MHDIDPLIAVAAERLRALPQEKAAPYGWDEFRRRSSRGRARSTWPQVPAGALPLGAAAAVLLVGGAAALTARMWDRSSPAANPSTQAGSSSSAIAADAEPGERAESRNERTRAIELWLARQPTEPAMVRVGSYAAVAGLEDRIAQLDDLLTTARAEGAQPVTLSPLENQRARLMSSLAQVRYAETLVAESPP